MKNKSDYKGQKKDEKSRKKKEEKKLINRSCYIYIKINH